MKIGDIALLGVGGFILYSMFNKSTSADTGSNSGAWGDGQYSVTSTPTTPTPESVSKVAATIKQEPTNNPNVTIATPTNVTTIKRGGVAPLTYTTVNLTNSQGQSTKGVNLVGTAVSSGVGISTQPGAVTTLSSGALSLFKKYGLA